MMYITHRSKATGIETQNIWYVGQPTSWEKIAYTDNVFAVQADGDELLHILDKFGGLPYVRNSNKKVWRWFGDHAKFIVGNL